MLAVTALPEGKRLMNIERYVDRLAKKARRMEPECATEPSADPLNSPAIELWSDAQGERFWLELDEENVTNRREPENGARNRRGARCLIRIGNPGTVAEVHAWKRRFEATIRQVNGRVD